VSDAQPRFRGVDRYIEKDKKEKYQSKREAIIEQYLYKEENLDLSDLDMNDYDITTMCYALNCRLLLSDNSFAKFVKKFVLAMIDVWKNTERTRHAYKILGVFPLHEVMNFLQRELVASDAQATTVLDILFNNINFSKFTRETIEFYQDIFGILLPEYFYAHGDKVCRTKCENILYSLEKKISMIGGEWVRIELSKSLILSLTRYGSSGDWSKSDAIYSYQDKQFLNGIFSKYGHLHLKEMLDVIYKLHMDKLLPEILLSVRDAFLNAPRKNENRKGELFVDAIKEDKTIVMMLITRAFWDFSADIKRDADLAKAFEDILEMLVEINYEEAATILDEFRVH
jgi:hypothetical protein